MEQQNEIVIQAHRYSPAHVIQVSSEGLASLLFHGDDGHCHKVSGPLGHRTLSTHMYLFSTLSEGGEQVHVGGQCPVSTHMYLFSTLSEGAGLILPLSVQPSCLHTTPTVVADMSLLPTLPQAPL